MPEGWLRVDLVILGLVALMVVSLAGLVVMATSDQDFDTLMDGPAFCWLPVSVMVLILGLGFLSNFLPYRGTGRRTFIYSLEDVEASLEMYLEAQGVRYERDQRVEPVRKAMDHRDTYSFELEGRPASIRVQGREGGSSTLVYVSPWPPHPGFVEGLERVLFTTR